MPQPYRPKGKLRFGPDALLERPELSAYIGAVATMWTVVEEGWGILLAEMLAADAKVGVQLYLALTGATSQASVLRTIANERLPEALQAEFGNLMKSERARAGERNRIVHGRWAIDPETPDALILGERDWLPKQIAEINHYYKRTVNTFAADEFVGTNNTFLSYRKPDFEATLGRLRAYSRDITSLAIKTKGALDRQAQEVAMAPKGNLLARGLRLGSSPGPLGPTGTPPEEPG